jgi:hypothetical protein
VAISFVRQSHAFRFLDHCFDLFKDTGLAVMTKEKGPRPSVKDKGGQIQTFSAEARKTRDTPNYGDKG